MEKRPIITKDPRFLQALREADRVASTPVAVLLEGATGTGKELLARRIHERSDNSKRPFLAMNCASFSADLAESELFGHVAGAFTGAIRERRGIFEETAGGTLFLDEIGELSRCIQAKLLRVLQEREIRRIGESFHRPVRFRLVAATNRNLRKERDEGRFREDLFYRIHVVRIGLPSLRERPGDIRLLAGRLLERIARCYGKEAAGIRDDALRLLEGYHWPGNVRELENELRRAVALVEEGGWLEKYHFSEPVRTGSRGGPRTAVTLQEKVVHVEISEILQTMDRTNGNKTRAAEELGLSRQGLKNKLARYGFA